MHCVNHPGTDAKSFCQNCGKALCEACVRTTPAGQILCEQCMATTGGDPSRFYWQAAQSFIPPAGPNPSTAAILGLIPGVGAMYNGQLFKGLIHVVIFAVLVSITDHYGVFGIFIGAWVLYQSFEAYQTAKARRDGLPLPDPFGLNELGSWLNLGSAGRTIHHPGQPVPPSSAAPGSAPPPNYTAGPYTAPYPGVATPAAGTPDVASIPTEPPPYSAPYTGPYQGAAYTTGAGYETATAPPYTAPYASTGYPPPQQPYTEPYVGVNPGPIPGINPDPYAGGYYPPSPFGSQGAFGPNGPVGMGRFGRGKEPVWAFILIGLGLIFLLHTMGFVGHAMRFAWPLLLIGFGVWLIINRVGPRQSPLPNSTPGQTPGPNQAPGQGPTQGGSK